ncbi:transglutaminase domain-containing protein [Prescottella soli]|uniref:Transglutaminase domain-containing protein n=1 Tax=Prescottella soli TaxID=1543852 RepID=A0ABW9G0E7_9NOCA
MEQTTILNWDDPGFHRFEVLRTETGSPGVEYLQQTHRWVQHNIRPVYALDDTQPTSVTLAKSRGSCSQRLAVVVALARQNGIPTKVEGLVLRGEFWYPRFRYLRHAIPDRVLLAWPSFRIDGEWIDASHAFTSGCDVSPKDFSNRGEETLFDVAARSTITWGNEASAGCLDLSRFVIRSLGTFDSRDDLFRSYGQTLPWAVRMALEPVFSRWGAR